MKNGYGEITQEISRVGLWFLGSALPLRLIAIYLYTKFYLNANSSFKVIFRTRYQVEEQTDGQSGDYMLPTFVEHKNRSKDCCHRWYKVA